MVFTSTLMSKRIKQTIWIDDSYIDPISDISKFMKLQEDSFRDFGKLQDKSQGLIRSLLATRSML